MWKYSKVLIKHFMHPHNVGEIKNADGIGRAGNPICGDVLTIYIKVKDNRLADVKFQTLGCLPGNEEVVMGDGTWKKISEITPFETVINSEGLEGIVKDGNRREYNGKMIKIVPFVSKFNSFLITPIHPILAVKRKWLKSSRRSSSRCEWLRVNKNELLPIKPRYVNPSELAEGDYLVYVPIRRTKDSAEMSIDLMKLLGYYLAEGYPTGSFRVLNFSLNKNERARISELKRLIKKIIKKKPKFRIRRNVIEFRVCSAKWTKFFSKIAGHHAHNKVLAPSILMLPTKKQNAMIKTYLAGDGNAYRRRKKDSLTYRIFTTSKVLAVQIQQILARQGIFASIKIDKRPRNSIEGRKINSHPLYSVTFKRYRKHNFYHSNGKYILVPIKKLEILNYSEKVYNLHTEKPNSYLVKGFAVHNCAAAIAVSSMITDLAKGKTLEQAMRITKDDIAKALRGLPPIKMHCSNLAIEALHAAIENYFKRRKRATK